MPLHRALDADLRVFCSRDRRRSLSAEFAWVLSHLSGWQSGRRVKMATKTVVLGRPTLKGWASGAGSSAVDGLCWWHKNDAKPSNRHLVAFLWSLLLSRGLGRLLVTAGNTSSRKGSPIAAANEVYLAHCECSPSFCGAAFGLNITCSLQVFTSCLTTLQVDWSNLPANKCCWRIQKSPTSLMESSAPDKPIDWSTWRKREIDDIHP